MGSSEGLDRNTDATSRKWLEISASTTHTKMVEISTFDKTAAFDSMGLTGLVHVPSYHGSDFGEQPPGVYERLTETWDLFGPHVGGSARWMALLCGGVLNNDKAIWMFARSPCSLNRPTNSHKRYGWERHQQLRHD